MNITKIQEADKTTFTLFGRLDSDTAPKLLDALLPEFDDLSHVYLDFTDLDYVSSTGLRILLQGHKAAVSKGGSMTIICVPDEVMETFNKTGFSEVLLIQ